MLTRFLPSTLGVRIVNYLKSYPMPLQALSSGSITGSGDLLCQSIEAYIDHKKTLTPEQLKQDKGFIHHTMNGNWNVDVKRLRAVAGFGFIFLGTVGSYWFPALHNFVLRKFPHVKPGTPRFVATKMGLEMCSFGPLYTFSFFPFVNFAEGKSFDDLKKKLESDFLQTLIVDEGSWLLINPILYGVVPVRLQLLFASVMSAIESMFFSYVAHNGFPKNIPVISPFMLKLFGEADDESHSSLPVTSINNTNNTIQELSSLSPITASTTPAVTLPSTPLANKVDVDTLSTSSSSSSSIRSQFTAEEIADAERRANEVNNILAGLDLADKQASTAAVSSKM